MTYEEAFKESLESPETFWGRAAEEITWYKKCDRVLDASNLPLARWFAGGELNTCYNAVDRHVESGRGDQTALIFDSPVTDTIKSFSYSDLRDRVSKWKGVADSKAIHSGLFRVSMCEITIYAPASFVLREVDSKL